MLNEFSIILMPHMPQLHLTWVMENSLKSPSMLPITPDWVQVLPWPCHRALHSHLNIHDLALPCHYRIKQPPLLATTIPEARQPNKAQEHPVNWIQGFSLEIVCQVCKSCKSSLIWCQQYLDFSDSLTLEKYLNQFSRADHQVDYHCWNHYWRT